MNEAIKLAIEKGGWIPRPVMDSLFPVVVDTHTEIHTDSYLLDPLFWQALGKALGWIEEIQPQYSMPWSSNGRAKWRFQMIRFVDWIAEGKDTDEFFKDLLKGDK